MCKEATTEYMRYSAICLNNAEFSWCVRLLLLSSDDCEAHIESRLDYGEHVEYSGQFDFKSTR